MTNIPKKIRRQVLQRDSCDGWACCVYCGMPGGYDGQGLHLHHFKHRSQGGKDEVDNLVTLCFDCHRALHDGDKDIEEAIGDYLRRSR